MTNEQLIAFKYYLEAKITFMMSPIFANEREMHRAEEEFDRVMLRDVGGPNHG